jgi:DNA modification methylase
MTSTFKLTTTANVELPYAGNKSNSQVIERVLLGLIKVPEKPIKPPSPRAIALCKANLDRYNQPRPIIVDDDNTILEGLEFLLAAQELGWTHINVVRLSGLSNEDRKIHALWLAKLPHLSDWDTEVLRVEFQEIISIDSDMVDLTGFSMGEIDVILDPEATEKTADPLDVVSETPTANEVVSQPGDMFLLGDHKILCGDSQKQENFDQLIGQEKARAVISDPPYNIKIRNNVSGLGKTKHDDFAFGVGEMSFEKFTSFLRVMFVLCSNGLIPGGLIYVFMDRRHLEELFAAAREAKLRIFDVGFWDKGSGGMGGMYRSQHEPCGVFKFGDDPHLNNVELGKHGRNRTNVWKHRGLSSFGKGRAEALAAHPTIKPVNLLAEIIKDCTKRGDIVLDPFLGAGSTLLAAQKTGRRSFGIELEPKYVDVTIHRWETMTGLHAIHAVSGLTFSELSIQRHAQDSSTDSTNTPVNVEVDHVQ